jgi:hypothetical protein
LWHIADGVEAIHAIPVQHPSRPCLKVRLGGTDVWIETEVRRITEPAPNGLAPRSRRKSHGCGRTPYGYDPGYCETLVETFQSLLTERIPNKVIAVFGLKLSGEGNVDSVKSDAEACLTMCGWAIARSRRRVWRRPYEMDLEDIAHFPVAYPPCPVLFYGITAQASTSINISGRSKASQITPVAVGCGG